MKVTFSLRKFDMLTSFTKINLFFFVSFEKDLIIFVGFITPVVKKWRIRIKSMMAAPTLVVVSRFM